jgi:hypothetical protein
MKNVSIKSNTATVYLFLPVVTSSSSHFCEEVFLKLGTVPIGIALSLRILRVIPVVNALSPESFARFNPHENVPKVAATVLMFV